MILRILIWMVLLLSSALSVVAQHSRHPQILKEAEKITFSNPSKALQLYDFVYKEGSKQDSISIGIKKMQLQQYLGDYEKAVTTSAQVQTLLEEDENPEMEVLYQLQRANLYRNIGFEDEGNLIFNEANRAFKNLSASFQEDNDIVFQYVNYGFLKNENRRKTVLKQMFPNIDSSHPYYFLLLNEAGKSELHTQKDSAVFYFSKTLQNEESSSVLYETAKAYLDWIAKDTVESNPPYIRFSAILDEDSKELFSEALVSFWAQQNNKDSLVKYLHLQHRIDQESELQKRKARIGVLDYYKNHHLREEEKEASQKRIFLTGGSIIFFMAGFILLFWHRLYRKKETPSEAVKSNVISDKAEEEVLKKLQDFEQSELFLDKNLRIVKMAKLLDTNTRYLSSVINSEKNKTFNAYINSLRIRYILDKLRTDDQFLTYKISYLAEVSGFVSQSSFTTAFKEETGKTPSAYIKEEIDRRKNIPDE